ncbi:autotransporter domain-containing protein, partial [Acidithiobacillus thiooxidans]
SMRIIPYADIAVQRNLDNNRRSISETLGDLQPVSEIGVAPDKTAFLTNVGTSIRIANSLSLYAEYEGCYAGNISSSGLAAGGVWRW